MTIVQRQEAERIIISVFLAIAAHSIVFLILHFSNAIVVEDLHDRSGPIFIRSIVVSTGPSSIESGMQLAGQQAAVDENILPAAELPEAGESRAVPREDPPTEQAVVHGTATEPTGQIQEDRPAPPRIEEPRPPQTGDIVQPAAVVEEHIFTGSDQGADYRIQMDKKTRKAQPAIRIPVNLPAWVNEREIEIEVVLSYVLDGDGRVTELTVNRSSGYNDVDEAVKRAFLLWKFPNPKGEDRITGTFTYKVN